MTSYFIRRFMLIESVVVSRLRADRDADRANPRQNEGAVRRSALTA